MMFFITYRLNQKQINFTGVRKTETYKHLRLCFIQNKRNIFIKNKLINKEKYIFFKQNFLLF